MSRIRKSPFQTLRRAKDAERRYRTGKKIGFTARSSLKAMGIVPRASGCYMLGPKYSFV